mmetsp:Transcript_89801/g.231861  ORF Transcript_89801/g.231861 Transcript_89801/m.231861 type:complete len:213 (+) Transcript_89801:972-1610(+)
MRVAIVRTDELRVQGIGRVLARVWTLGLQRVAPVARVLLLDADAQRMLVVIILGRDALRLGLLWQERHRKEFLLELLPELFAHILAQVVRPPHHGLPAVAVAQWLVQVRGAPHDLVHALPVLPVLLRGAAQATAVGDVMVDVVQLRAPAREDPRHEALELRGRPVAARLHEATLGLLQEAIERAAHVLLPMSPVLVARLWRPSTLQVASTRR